jgi:hypothetical protein
MKLTKPKRQAPQLLRPFLRQRLKSVVARDCEASAGYYLMTWIPPLFECQASAKINLDFCKARCVKSKI